jgi:hypothetical protein
MKYAFNEEDLKHFVESGEMTQLIINNWEILYNNFSFQGRLVEMKAAKDAGSIYLDMKGCDEMHPIKNKIENKFTKYIMPTGELRLNSAGKNKLDGFHFMRIIDGINERIFEIPHDVYYERGKFYGNEFRWSASYNKTDKLQRGNTQLLLDYEITE